MRLSTVVGMAIAVVIVAVLWYVTRPPAYTPAPATERTLPAPTDTAAADALIEEVLESVPVDSAAIKSRWMDEVKNVDLAGLEGERLEVFLRHANARRCTCGCGFTLAACRTYDPTCPVSGPILESLRDSVKAGRVRSAAGLRERPASEPAHGG